jgi:hypothetical protein
MKQYRLINQDDPLEMTCLHHTFGPRIQSDLEEWKDAHNNCKIRTAGEMTPHQLFVVGVTRNRNRDSSAINNLSMSQTDIARKISEFYESHNLEEPSNISRVLPRNPLTLYITESKISTLNATIDVSRHSDTGGIEIFVEVLEYVKKQHLLE